MKVGKPFGDFAVRLAGFAQGGLIRRWADTRSLVGGVRAGTLSGGRMSPDNFRSRVLRAAVRLAGERLEAEGLAPLPDKLTPHGLRRTFCSLLYALGETPSVVMDEMGHTDPALALQVYAQAMRRGEDEQAQLRALVESGVLADSGQRDENTVENPAADEAT